jgi:hypothetical protein
MTPDQTADDEVHDDFRSGAKLAGELIDEFNEIESSEQSSRGDSFSIRNESLTGLTSSAVIDKAAKHGFRVSFIHGDGRTIGFKRMDNDPTDPRND